MATKRMTRIEHMRDVLVNGYKRIQGKTVDSFTASMYVQIYDKLSAENQVKLESRPLLEAINIGWQLASGKSK